MGVAGTVGAGACAAGTASSVPVRALVEGVRYRTRTGCPWRDVPDRYGPWWRVYTLFACWQLLGVWEKIESALLEAADAAGKLSWQVSVDSTTSRAHVHAAGARRDSVERVAGEPDHHELGTSRGGWSTKTHVAIDQHRGVLSFVLTPGQHGDSPQMATVLDGIHISRSGPGPGTHQAGSGAGRQGVLLPREPRLAACARDPRDHPGPRRPGRTPPAQGLPRRPAPRSSRWTRGPCRWPGG
ncbi:IS5 family transposase [Segeticoccus rhizosphaerae]|uniref:IS5 family transposase n=1 Tax=Segeticoccus rhizosphaerae TaxID=1104777 RepID=UPI003B84690C